jgi:hypothetical protein
MRADSTKKRPGDGAFFLFWRSFVSFRAPRDSGAGVGGAVGVRSLASRRAQARHLEPAKGLYFLWQWMLFEVQGELLC